MASSGLSAYLMEQRAPLRKELQARTIVFGEPEDRATFRKFGSYPGLNMKKFDCVQAVNLITNDYLTRDKASRYRSYVFADRYQAAPGDGVTRTNDLMPGWSNLHKVYERLGYEPHPFTGYLIPPELPKFAGNEDADGTVASRASAGSRGSRHPSDTKLRLSDSMPDLRLVASASKELPAGPKLSMRHRSTTDLRAGQRPPTTGGQSAMSVPSSITSARPLDTMASHADSVSLIKKMCARDKKLKFV